VRFLISDHHRQRQRTSYSYRVVPKRNSLTNNQLYRIKTHNEARVFVKFKRKRSIRIL